MRPRLKNAVWHRDGEDLYVISDPEEQIVLTDPDGQVERLLSILAEGTRDIEQLSGTLGDVGDAIATLDGIGLLLDSDRPLRLTVSQRDRNRSNLAFFTTFARLDRAPEELQQRLLDAHVLFLGTGGLGSTAIQALSGAGVARMTLLDADTVESPNFARQYLYRHSDIGQPKVERAAAWIRAFSPEAAVTTVRRWIDGPSDIADLLHEVDLVIAGVDRPDDIDLWVNEACVAAGVPYVRGGMVARRVSYRSVDPGRTPCFACYRHAVDQERQGIPTAKLREGLERVNRGTGPVASLLGGLVALEGLRYLTGFAPPIAGGRHRFVDLVTGENEVLDWQRWPDCPVCRRAPQRRESSHAAQHDG